MYSIKGSWVGQTFALAKSNDAGGKKTRIQRSKEERKEMVESFIKRYQKLNNGSFPSLNLTQKEVGGSFYTVREIVREIIQENKVLGPATSTSEEQSFNQFVAQNPLGSIATEPQISLPLSSDENNAAPKRHEVTSEGVVIISGVDNELQNVDNGHISDSIQVDAETKKSDEIVRTVPQVIDFSEADGKKEPTADNGHIINGAEVDAKGSESDEIAHAVPQVTDFSEADGKKELTADNGHIIDVAEVDDKGSESDEAASTVQQVKDFSEAGKKQHSADNGQIIDGVQVDVKGSESDELASRESQVSKAAHADCSEENPVANRKSTTLVQSDVKSFVSDGTPSAELQVSKTTEADGHELRSVENGNTINGLQADIKAQDSDNLGSTELQMSKTLEVGEQGHQSVGNGQIKDGLHIDVKTGSSDKLTTTESQVNRSSGQCVDAQEKMESLIKVPQMIEDVVVETFPLRPSTKSVDSKDRNTGDGMNSTKSLEEKEIAKVEVGGSSGSHSVNGITSQKHPGLALPEEKDVENFASSQLEKNPVLLETGKKRQTSAAGEGINSQVSSQVKNPNSTYTDGKDGKTVTQGATLVKAKAGDGHSRSGSQKASSQKDSNATLDRIDLQSWEGRAKKQEANPIWAILKAFVDAFVKLWSE